MKRLEYIVVTPVKLTCRTCCSVRNMDPHLEPGEKLAAEKDFRQSHADCKPKPKP